MELDNTRGNGWVAVAALRFSLRPDLTWQFHINIISLKTYVRFLFPASYLHTIATLILTTGGDSSNMNPPILHFPFAFFEDFQPFPSQSVEPIITELFFLSFFIAVPENSLFRGATRSERRLLKKPQRINRRIVADRQFRVQTWTRRPPSLRSSKPNILRFFFPSLSLYVSCVLFHIDFDSTSFLRHQVVPEGETLLFCVLLAKNSRYRFIVM